MSTFRMVHTSFWQDPTVIEEMTPEDKYFFLYLLTNKNTTQIGIYQITKKQMAFDMGYSVETINALLDRFLTKHKLIKYNDETREIAIKNWGKYNLNRGGKPMLDCVKSELTKVKCKELIKYVATNIKNKSIKSIYDTYDDTSNVTSRDDEIEENSFVEEEMQLSKSSNEITREVNENKEEANEINNFNDTSTIRTTISTQYKEKEKEEYKDKDNTDNRIHDLYVHYLSKNIVAHRKLTNAMKTAIKARLKDYSFGELKKAIDNYAHVLKSDMHWFTHVYPLADFMRDKDIRKFLDEADPLNNFLIKSKFNKNTNNFRKTKHEEFPDWHKQEDPAVNQDDWERQKRILEERIKNL